MSGWEIFWLFFPISIAFSLGIYFGRGQKSLNDYFLGGSELPWFALSLSIVATETSTLTFIGIPAIAYGTNWTFLQVAMGYIIGRYIIAKYFIPAYWRGDLLSAYGYIQEKYGSGMGKFVSLVFIITRTLADGVRLFATALPVKFLLNISLTEAIALIAIVTILYTFWGGLKAVVWMDVIQFFFYLIGSGIAVFFALSLLDFNLGNLFSQTDFIEKVRIFDFQNWNGYGFILSLLGGMLLTIGSHGTDQIIVQRVLAAGDIKSAKKAITASGWIVLVQFVFFLSVGTLIYFGLKQNGISPDINSGNEIFPWFIIHKIPLFFKGFIIAGLMAAAMSTLSSSLNALASSTINDLFYGKKFFPKLSDILLARIVSLAWGIILIVPAILASQWGNVLEAGLGIAAVTYVVLIFIFSASVIFPDAGAVEVFWSAGGGLVGVLILKNLFSIFWLWTIPIGLSIAFALFLLIRKLKH